MMRLVLHVAAVILVTGHMSMISPPGWQDPAGKYTASNMWLQAGCGDTPPVKDDKEHKKEGCVMEWYMNWTFIPKTQEPTIPEDSMLRTFKSCPFPSDGGPPSKESCRTHPWAAPGTAAVASPCGVDGGNPNGCPAGNPGQGGCAPGGYGHGPDARAVYQNRSRNVTQWVAGTEVEVKSAVMANHGGGYSYRLCRKTANLMDLTEECFQKGSLEFIGNTSAVFNADEANRIEIPSYSISLPTGHWRQNPVPACNDPSGGAPVPFLHPFGLCLNGYQFEPRAQVNGSKMAGFSGYFASVGVPSMAPLHKWYHIDKVKVPEELPAGEYVMSYRADMEQTPQVWNVCADITIVKSAVVV